MAGVILKNLNKSYGAVNVIENANLDVEDGSFVAFVGPSGCGKSTLLRMIAGLEDISGGEIFINDVPVSNVEPADRGVAMVFQSYALYPHLSVRQNLSFGLKMTGNPKQDTQARVKKAAEILQIEALMERRPKQLSGGQRQRVAIGRAIVREPNVFLFDEPLSNLDAELRIQMRVELAHLHRRLGTTMIYVTHDQTEAMTLADKIVVLNHGRIEQIGTPLDIYHNPVNQFVAGFIGAPKMNFLPAKILSCDHGRATLALFDDMQHELTLPLATPLANGTRLTLGIRPEHFVKAGEGNCDLNCTIDVIEQLGNTSYAYVNIAASHSLIVEQAPDDALRAGQTLTIGINAARILLFDESGARLQSSAEKPG